jgi:hypothetical protein
VDLDEEAVLSGDPIALAELVHPAGQLGDPGQLARGGPDPDERGDRQAERGRVDLRAVAGDDAGALQALDPLGNRRADIPTRRARADLLIRGLACSSRTSAASVSGRRK